MASSEAAAPGVPSIPLPQRATEVIGRFWAWLFLLTLVVFFSLTAQGFLSLFNFQSVVANAALLLIMALGQTYVIITGGIDLSTGYLMGMVSVVAVMVMTSLTNTLPVPLAVLFGMLAGLLAGLSSDCSTGRSSPG